MVNKKQGIFFGLILVVGMVHVTDSMAMNTYNQSKQSKMTVGPVSGKNKHEKRSGTSKTTGRPTTPTGRPTTPVSQDPHTGQ
jgi:hypothetical protein